MKRSSFLKIGVFVFFSLVIASTSFAGRHSSKPDRPDIPDGWSEIDPADVYPEFKYNGLTPSCAAPPPTIDPETGEFTTYDPEFTFFVKGGETKNLVVYFQGGGGCWDSVNCLYAHTYSEERTETEEMFAYTEGMGIFDTANPKNPFKDWSFVYIPYCTGDIHWGANDAEYPDPWFVYDGNPQTIQHRGFVNFQVVLKWIKENFKRPQKIFVTGISAGSYGAIGGFPFIKEAFPLSKVYVLGDAGNGVTPEAFRDGGFDN